MSGSLRDLIDAFVAGCEIKLGVDGLCADLAGGAVGADMGFPGATDVSSAINPLRYSLTPWEVERLKVQALETSRPRPIIPEWTTIDYDCIQPAFMKVIFEGAEIEPSMADAEVAANAALEE